MASESVKSQPVTELVTVPLKADIDVEAGDHKKTLDETLATIASQPGCKSVHYGLRIEDPKFLQMAVCWEKLQDHYNFEAQPYYQPFLEGVGSLLDGDVSIFHVQLPSDQPFADAAAAPVTECVTTFFEPDHPNSEYDASWAKFREEGLKSAKEGSAIVGGWVVEELEHEKVDQGKAKAFALFIGWSSVQAHMDYRQSEHFPEVIKHLRNGPKAMSMHHVAFKKV